MKERSKIEINVRRLLDRCELMAKEDPRKDWRLEKYIEALQDMIKTLQSSSIKPSSDTMMQYVRRVEFLKGVLCAAKLPSPVERAIAAQMLPSTVPTSNELDGPNIAMQIHQKTTSKYNQEVREELLGSNGTSGDGIRQRLLGQSGKTDNLDELINHNRNMQEKIAENMLLMTRSIKENALTASAIIKSDIAELNKSDQINDASAEKLKAESLKLEEYSKSNWRCWQWVMIAIVIVVFVLVTLFMKVVKKKSRA